MKRVLWFLAIFFLFFLQCASNRKTASVTPGTPGTISQYSLALSLVESHKYEQGLAVLDTAITHRPEYAQFYFARGQVLELLGRKEEAIQVYQRALTLKSFFPEVWKNLFQLYNQAGEYGKASKFLEKLVENESDSLNYVLLLAEAYFQDGQTRLSQEEAIRFIREGGRSVQVEKILGLSYFRENNFSKAIPHLEAFVNALPGDFPAEKALGISCIESGLLEKGMQHLNKALALNPDDPELYLFRAKYFMGRKKYPAAEEQFRFASRLDSSNQEILLEKSKFFFLKKDSVRAKNILIQIVKKDSTCWECFRLLGEIGEWEGEQVKAAQYFQKYLLHIDYRDPETEQRLQVLRKKIGKSKLMQ